MSSSGRAAVVVIARCNAPDGFRLPEVGRLWSH
jgi:hypothetical protein